MANSQIPNLPAVVAVTGPELVESVQSGTSVKVSLEQIATYIQGAINIGITLLDTTAPLTGGPITTTGTIGIASNGIDNSILANMQNSRVKANISGSLNSPSDVTVSDLLDYAIGSSQGMIARRGLANWNGLVLGSSGEVLTSNGTTAIWAAPAYTGTVTSVNASGGTTGLTFSGGPITSSGTLTLAGTLIPANGGTGISSYGVGDILYASATGTLSKLADVATGNALISGGVGVAPSYGKIGLTTHITGTLAIANGGTGATTKTAAFDALSPMTTAGDLILGGAIGTGTRLGIGTSGQVLTSNGTTATWSAPAYTGTVTSVNVSGGTTGLTFSGGPVTTSGTITMSGTLAIANGGTGATTASGARTALGLGTIATQNANSVAITGGSITILDTGLTLQDNVDPTKQVQFDLAGITTATTRTITLPNTSGAIAALNLAQTFSSSQTFSSATNSFGTSTATGTTELATGATISGATKTLNIGTGGVAGSTTTINIGPTAGAGTVTFGSGLTSVTIPTLSLTNALTVANGGTGATTAAAGFNNLSPITSVGDLILGSGVNTASRLAIGTTGQVLTVSGGTAVWASPAGTVSSVNASGGTTGLTFTGGPITSSGTLTLGGTLAVPNGGTGASTLTGYVKGNGTSAITASATIPNTDITGLGTMSTQNSGSVSITGGTITGITDLAVADGGTGASTLTGYVKGNGTSAITASATIPNTDVTGLGTMSTQAASSVSITGGTINGTNIGATTAGSGTFTDVTVVSTDPGSGLGPDLQINRNSASPAAGDNIGTIRINGRDSAGNLQTYAMMYGYITDPTNLSEAGGVAIQTVNAGVLSDAMIIDANGKVSIQASFPSLYSFNDLVIGKPSSTGGAATIVGSTRQTIQFTNNISASATQSATIQFTNATGRFSMDPNGAAVTPLFSMFDNTSAYSGRIGVSTNTPAYTVDVNGTLNATTIRQNGIALGTIATQDANNVAITGGSITILDNGLTLQDNVDPTKQVQFDLAGITTATTRTITLPNTSGAIAALNLAQTFSSSQTFSNATNSFGTSTGTGTTSLATGATLSGNTKTVNIGTGGVAGSTTTITIGPTAGTGTVTFNCPVSAASSVLSTSPTAGIGYATGAGGTVTQITSRTTGVTINKVSGAITLFSAAGSTTPTSFTVTNSAVAATDTISLSQKSGTNLYVILVTAVAAGSFQITFYTTGGTATDAPVINFNVIKGVAA